MSKDPHEPFDKVTLTGPDGKEHDVTNVFNGDGDHDAFDLEGEGEAIALFPESEEEKDARRQFYDTTPARSDEYVNARINTISVSGSLPIPHELNNLATVTVTIADADGQVLTSGTASIRAGFKFHETKEANIAERAHKAKLR